MALVRHDEIARRLMSDTKRQLARELHDSVAQTLTLMVVQMEHLKLDVAEQQAVVARIERLQGSAREVLHRLRQALYHLREEPAVDTGFVAYVRALLDCLGHGSGVRMRLILAAGWPPALSQATAHGLRRIVVEALYQVVPHSTAVEVELAPCGGQAVLEFRADGVPPPGGERRLSRGLLGLRDLVAVLGGRVRVSRGQGGWETTVRVALPWPSGDGSA